MAENKKVRINQADVEALQQLPGIGRSLADKIIAARPLDSVKDLLEIRGLGKATFDGIEPLISLPRSKPHKKTLPGSDGLDVVDSSLKLDQPHSLISEDGRGQDVKQERVEKVLDRIPKPEPVVDGSKRSIPKAVTDRKTLSRAETLWLVFGVGFIAMILAVVTTLVIISGINETLNFNRLQSVQSIESNLSVLQRELGNISSELDSFDQRLQPLEGLSGRVVIVEEQVGSLQGVVDDAVITVGSMQADLDWLLTENTRLSDRIIRFDNFLDGLEELLRVISNTEIMQ